MSNRSSRILTGISWIAFLGAFALYLHGLPSAVQTGDTGELVANSYLYQVSHPSGYPLWINLQYVFTHMFQVGSVFYRASLLNALFGLGALLFVFFSSRNRWLGLGVALCLGFSRTFWQYSELPDVFALNSLIAAGIVFFYCRNDLAPRLRIWGASLLFFAGLGNHLSIVFLAPLVIGILLSAPRRKEVYLSLAAGLGLLISTYSSLMLMHPDSLNSWGSIKTPGAVLSHFLREDYGRTRYPEPKSATPEQNPVEATPASAQAVNAPAAKAPAKTGTQFTREVGKAWEHLLSGISAKEFQFYLKSFTRYTCQDFSPILVILGLFIALSLYERTLDRRAVLLTGIILVYCYVFFSMIKIAPRRESLEVVERFFILPQILLCFLLILWMPRRIPGRYTVHALSLILLIQAGVSVAQNLGVNDFSKNTIVEDHALNLLQATPETRPSVILAEDDTQYFALKYCQQIHGVRPQALVVSAPLLFHSWYSKKIFDQGVGFSFDAASAQSSLRFNLEKDLILPNVERMPFFISAHFNDSERFKLTYLALGRRIEAGRGEFFDDRDWKSFRFRSTAENLKSDPADFDPFRKVFSQYAYYHLALGRRLHSDGDLPASQKEFLEALRKVPYCLPAVENLCVLKNSVSSDTMNCQDRIKPLRAANFDYYAD